MFGENFSFEEYPPIRRQQYVIPAFGGIATQAALLSPTGMSGPLDHTFSSISKTSVEVENISSVVSPPIAMIFLVVPALDLIAQLVW